MKAKKLAKKIRRIFLCIFLSIVAVIVISAILIYPKYRDFKSKVYPILSEMDESSFQRNGTTDIYDSAGKQIGKLGVEKYQYIPVSDISEYVKNGYIAQEDKTFAVHNGVDLKATLRAAIALVKNKGEITQGGSTITQQVIKNNLLTQERSYTRKILEILLAFELEKQFNKAQIMEFYCNSNYYGQNCYGIEGASRYYFGKHASDLSLSEAAILVGTSNSPNNYNPVANYDLAMEKKKQVLGHMLQEGYITQEEHDTAAADTPEVKAKSSNAKADSYQISYAVHCAALKLMELDGFKFQYTFASGKKYAAYQKKYQAAYKEASDKIRGGGYVIRTSLDSGIQKKLQKSVNSGLSDFSKKQKDGRYDVQGAAVCIDNTSHMVVAIVGGRGTKDSYNRGFQAERQPGSSIKPLLVYGPAINEGYITPATVMTDKKVDIHGYEPENAGGGYRGNMKVREALARSINTIAVQIYDAEGKDTGMSYLDSMRFSSLAYADSTIYSVALGGFTNGVTPADMASGYACFGNGGKFIDDTCITSLEHKINGPLYTFDEGGTEVFSEDTAFIMTDMMQGVFQESYGTAHAYTDAINSGQIYAGKTGTTNSSKDAWFCGLSPYYTTTVWVGCDTPKHIEGLSGNTYPAGIWVDFMEKLHEGLEPKEFPMPQTILLSNSNGKEKQPSYSTGAYDDRPSGWDYISGLLKDKIAENIEKKQEQERLEEAEKAVAAFEEFQIENASDAADLEKLYNGVVSLIQALSDEDAASSLMDRAAAKYGLLNGDVASRWIDAQQAISDTEREMKNAENLEKAQESLEKANQQIHDSYVNVVEWYIKHLNARTLYTDNVAKMITDGEYALENCEGMEEYNDLYTRFQQAKSYAENLPKQTYDDYANTPNELDYLD